jgi:hypothetical protein
MPRLARRPSVARPPFCALPKLPRHFKRIEIGLSCAPGSGWIEDGSARLEERKLYRIACTLLILTLALPAWGGIVIDNRLDVSSIAPPASDPLAGPASESGSTSDLLLPSGGREETDGSPWLPSGPAGEPQSTSFSQWLDDYIHGQSDLGFPGTTQSLQHPTPLNVDLHELVFQVEYVPEPLTVILLSLATLAVRPKRRNR